jgi:5-formyltetrahydrofolate cyclo-ligase
MTPSKTARAGAMTDPADHHEALNAIRARMRAELSTLSDEERHRASSVACMRLTNLDAFRNASVVLLYMPLAGEVDATPAAIRCFQFGKTVCVPRVDWNRRDITAIEVDCFDDHYMETDEHGVRSPRQGRPFVPASIDLVVVPGLAFDTRGRRVGRAGGCYERYLMRLHRSTVKVGLAFDRQIIDRIPAPGDDTRMNVIVTDRRVTRTRARRSRR